MDHVFISYSWDDEAHKTWVMNLRDRLDTDGVETILDRVDLRLGDPIPAFMEQSIRRSSVVLLVLTPNYKRKADDRTGGVGYEGSIITGELLSGQKKRTYIPVLARGDWDTSSPTWLCGKNGVDLSGNPYSEGEYRRLLEALPKRGDVLPEYAPDFLYSLSGKQLKLITCLFATEGKLVSELSSELNLTESSVRYQLKGLVSQGVVERCGLKFVLSNNDPA